MSIASNIQKIKSGIHANVTLVAVSKTKSNTEILEAYHSGQKVFGENRVQELLLKFKSLPKDIEWHLIGHLQTNKVKDIVGFVSLIQSVDSMKLLKVINTEAAKIDRVVNCLLEIKIAKEASKYGLSFNEAETIVSSGELSELKNVKVIGLMGIATLSDDQSLIRNEFNALTLLFRKLSIVDRQLSILSFGMSSDYHIAIEEGSTMIRVGSLIFGVRSIH